MTRITIFAIALLAISGCEKKEKPPARNVPSPIYAAMKKFRVEICACSTKACAEVVLERLATWLTEAEKSKGFRPTPTPAQAQEMKTVTEEIAKCAALAMPPAAVAPPPKSAVPAAITSPATVEQLLAATRTWARGEDEKLQIVQLEGFYIGADGTVDPDSGKVSIELGVAAPPVDDPKRKVGAPIKPPAARPTCVAVPWTATNGWAKESRSGCREAASPFPRCTVAEIWNRAIAKGAPPDALAVLRLDEGAPRRWSFSITDEPRKIKIDYQIDDDCELAVEKP